MWWDITDEAPAVRSPAHMQQHGVCAVHCRSHLCTVVTTACVSRAIASRQPDHRAEACGALPFAGRPSRGGQAWVMGKSDNPP